MVHLRQNEKLKKDITQVILDTCNWEHFIVDATECTYLHDEVFEAPEKKKEKENERERERERENL